MSVARWGLGGLIVLCAAACNPDNTFDGTAVGNPGTNLTVDTPFAPDLETVSGQAESARVALKDCEGGTRELVAGVNISLVGASSFNLPVGDWCGVRLSAPSGLLWSGTTDTEHTFSVAMDLTTLAASTNKAFTVDEEVELVLQLGGPNWLSAAALGAVATDVTLGPDDDVTKDLEDIVDRETVVFIDANANGVRDGSEGVVAATRPQDWGLGPDDDTDDDTDEHAADSDDDTDPDDDTDTDDDT